MTQTPQAPAAPAPARAPEDPQSAADLSAEVAALREEIGRLNAKRFFRMETTFWSIAMWASVRGLFFGLGSILGASIVLSILVQMLSSIDFIPVVGDWAQQLIDEIQRTKPN